MGTIEIIQKGNLVFLNLDLVINNVDLSSTTTLISNLPKPLKAVNYVTVLDQTNAKWVVGSLTTTGVFIPGYTSNRILKNTRILSTIQYVCADVS